MFENINGIKDLVLCHFITKTTLMYCNYWFIHNVIVSVNAVMSVKMSEKN